MQRRRHWTSAARGILPAVLAGSGTLLAGGPVPAWAGPGLPLLLDVREAVSPATPPPAHAADSLPPGVDLRRLRVSLEEYDLDGTGPQPVLAIELISGNGSEPFPEGLRLDLHLAFGPVPQGREASADHVLTAALERPVDSSQRRRRLEGEPPAVLRFSGLEGLGELGSMEPGRSITFRMPARRLLDGASPAQAAAARQKDGSWRLSLWAESRLGAAADRLPASGGAELRVPDAPRP